MSEEGEKRFLVIAGNYRQFADWCHEQGFSEKSGRAIFATPQSMRGRTRQQLEVVRVGTWQDRPYRGRRCRKRERSERT